MPFKAHHLIRSFNGQLAFAVALLSFSQVNYGMDLAAFSTTQAMNAFDKKFGVFNPVSKTYNIEPYFLSLLNSLTYVGQVVGVLLGGYISRQWGRRMSLFTMTFWAMLSAILLITAQTKEQMLAGRILNYVYLGQEITTIPVMQSEICPPGIRGYTVGSYQLGILVGSLIMSCVAYGTSTMTSEASYRIPLGLFFVVPTVVFIGVWFIPESPRFLLMKNRREEALQALTRYRQGRFTEDEIQEEFEAQVAMMNVTVEQGGLKELWKGINLKRTLIILGANFCLQATGQSFISKYGTLFLKDIGGVNPFAMTCINSALFICATATAMYVCDMRKIGRKTMLVGGTFLQSVCLLAMAGVGSRAMLSHSNRVSISALLTVSYIGWCLSWGPLSHIVTSEIPSSRLRDVSYTVASVVNVVTQFVVSFCIPYLLYAPYANLGSRVGFIFGSISAVTIVYVWFCIPECCKLSLEEIDYLFMQKTPLRKFGNTEHGTILPPELVTAEASEKHDGGAVLEHREIMA